MDVTIYKGDLRERLAEIEDDSIDAIVTDPPYGLGFMGKAWDRSAVELQPETWAALLRVAKPGAHLVAFGGTRTFHRIWCAIEDGGWEIRDTLMWLYGQGFPKSANQDGDWEGWGTALKPAFEPIVLARKPLAGTVAENLELYGVGALNIDGCRIPGGEGGDREGEESAERRYTERGATNFAPTPGPRGGDARGRWPANVLHDGSDEVVAMFPESDGQQGDVRGDEPSAIAKNAYGKFAGRVAAAARRDAGSAARFFWSPKASRRDRNEGLEGMPKGALNWSSGEQNPGSFQSAGTNRYAENFHPTVKPTELMRWLCRLVAPAGATILDPFMGSGSTGKAAVLEGMNFIGVELESEYVEIARRRIESRDPLFTRAAVK